MDIEKIEKKLSSILVVVIIIGFLLYPVVTKLPKVMKDFGLNNYMQYKNYKTMLEFNIKDGPDFAIVVNKNNKVLTHFYFNKEALDIKNEKIDNINYKESITRIFEKLYEDDISTDITITSYDNHSLTNSAVDSVNNSVSNYGLKSNIKQNKSKLQNKSKQLNLKEKKRNRIFILLSMYSSDVANGGINRKSKNIVKREIDTDKYKEYSVIVYKKLEKYQSINNVVNQNINESSFNIYNVPASDDIYPDKDSWYYIKNGKVYAYIKFVSNEDIYNICYNGDVDNYNEGSCADEK